MSKNYWAIQGYGVKVSESMFDVEKMRPLTDLNEEEYREILEEDGGLPIFEDGFLGDVLDSLSPMLQYGDTGNLHLGSYLIYPFKAPWEMEVSEKGMTELNIIDIIHETLLPYLKDSYDREWLENNIGYIHTCGGSD